MIIQPEWGTRNVNKYFYETEAQRIAALNEIFGDVELTAAEMRTLIWLCVTFDESNKAYAPYPALIARKGRKDID